MPCFDCYDFESAATHEIGPLMTRLHLPPPPLTIMHRPAPPPTGHVLGLNHPDEYPEHTRLALTPMGPESCRDPLSHLTAPGRTLDGNTVSKADAEATYSVMNAFTQHPSEVRSPPIPPSEARARVARVARRRRARALRGSPHSRARPRCDALDLDAVRTPRRADLPHSGRPGRAQLLVPQLRLRDRAARQVLQERAEHRLAPLRHVGAAARAHRAAAAALRRRLRQAAPGAEARLLRGQGELPTPPTPTPTPCLAHCPLPTPTPPRASPTVCCFGRFASSSARGHRALRASLGHAVREAQAEEPRAARGDAPRRGAGGAGAPAAIRTTYPPAAEAVAEAATPIAPTSPPPP